MRPLALIPSLLHSALVDGIEYRVIWSVCFSPDGKLLATGCGGGVVRVSSRTFMLAIFIAAIIVFEVNAQPGATFGAPDLGYRLGKHPLQIPGSHPGGFLARFLVGREICHLWVGRPNGEDLERGGRASENPCNPQQGWKRGYQL